MRPAIYNYSSEFFVTITIQYLQLLLLPLHLQLQLHPPT